MRYRAERPNSCGRGCYQRLPNSRQVKSTIPACCARKNYCAAQIYFTRGGPRVRSLKHSHVLKGSSPGGKSPPRLTQRSGTLATSKTRSVGESQMPDNEALRRFTVPGVGVLSLCINRNSHGGRPPCQCYFSPDQRNIQRGICSSDEHICSSPGDTIGLSLPSSVVRTNHR